jgi:hypothetical protein
MAHPNAVAHYTEMAAEAEAQNRRQAYEKALKSHDWMYQYSDDRAAYAEGRWNFVFIKREQPLVDPTGELWNQHAPQGYKIEVRA